MRYRVTVCQVPEGKDALPIFELIVSDMLATDAARAVDIALHDMWRASFGMPLARDVEIDIRVRKID